MWIIPDGKMNIADDATEMWTRFLIEQNHNAKLDEKFESCVK